MPLLQLLCREQRGIAPIAANQSLKAPLEWFSSSRAPLRSRQLSIGEALRANCLQAAALTDAGMSVKVAAAVHQPELIMLGRNESLQVSGPVPEAARQGRHMSRYAESGERLVAG
jgi:hypothetical protein